MPGIAQRVLKIEVEKGLKSILNPHYRKNNFWNVFPKKLRILNRLD
jgi:hypothetical protein